MSLVQSSTTYDDVCCTSFVALEPSNETECFPRIWRAERSAAGSDVLTPDVCEPLFSRGAENAGVHKNKPPCRSSRPALLLRAAGRRRRERALERPRQLWRVRAVARPVAERHLAGFMLQSHHSCADFLAQAQRAASSSGFGRQRSLQHNGEKLAGRCSSALLLTRARSDRRARHCRLAWHPRSRSLVQHSEVFWSSSPIALKEPLPASWLPTQ